MRILGIRHGHDAAAALVVDGEIVADVSEERFSRIKNDTSFPLGAIGYCLRQGGIEAGDLDCIALPGDSVPRSLATFFDVPASSLPRSGSAGAAGALRAALRGRDSATPQPLFELPLYQQRLRLDERCRVHLAGHHMAHAASAWFTSGLERRALVVTLDGRGDDVSVGLWRGEGNRIERLRTWDGRASLGWFFANATEALGWRHGSDEWKMMGLAPYGHPREGSLAEFHPHFRDGDLQQGRDYGEFSRWNDHGANHYHGRDAGALSRIAAELGHEDFAATAQQVIEEQAAALILPWLEREGTRALCCAGGVFLNVKMNQRLWESGRLDTQWIYPNPGDAGLAVGAALHAWHTMNPDATRRPLQHVYLGPAFDDAEIRRILDDRRLAYQELEDPAPVVARHLADGHIVGWFQGRMESGPRALGNRSILMSPLDARNKDIINARIKYREPFRPFCPSILYERRDDYLPQARDEHFMITSFAVSGDVAARIPAVVHVDGTVRPQLVRREVNPRYHDLIREFGAITGEHALLNTSFNIKGEPIVCHPREAIRCFFDTGIDVLVLGRFLLRKARPGPEAG